MKAVLIMTFFEKGIFQGAGGVKLPHENCPQMWGQSELAIHQLRENYLVCDFSVFDCSEPVRRRLVYRPAERIQAL